LRKSRFYVRILASDGRIYGQTDGQPQRIKPQLAIASGGLISNIVCVMKIMFQLRIFSLTLSCGSSMRSVFM